MYATFVFFVSFGEFYFSAAKQYIITRHSGILPDSLVLDETEEKDTTHEVTLSFCTRLNPRVSCSKTLRRTAIVQVDRETMMVTSTAIVPYQRG